MRYIVDHDLHIHSQLSSCSRHPEQTAANILAYGEANGLTTLCLTDHMWDNRVEGASGWYAPQSYEHICQARPLPRSEKVNFLFGCETELNGNLTVGVSREVMDQLDFIIIPTNHLHMSGYTCRGDEGIEERAALCRDRMEAVLNMDLPFHKIGLAHLTCPLLYRENYLAVLDTVTDGEWHSLFAHAAKVGVGIELNFNSFAHTGDALESELRPYRIALEEGCKFYFGSDAHNPGGLARAKENFEHIVDLLDLKEENKFRIAGMKE